MNEGHFKLEEASSRLPASVSSVHWGKGHLLRLFLTFFTLFRNSPTGPDRRREEKMFPPQLPHSILGRSPFKSSDFLFALQSLCPRGTSFANLNSMAQGNPDQLADIDGGFLSNPQQSIFAHIELGLLKNPHKPAVICMHQDENHLGEFVRDIDQERLSTETKSDAARSGCLTLTYSQLHRGALRLATGLLASGIGPGSTVLCMIPNGAEYALLLWTCALLRLTIAAVDPSVGRDKAELRAYLQSVQPSLIIVAGLKDAILIDSAVAQRPGLQLPQLRHRVVLDVDGGNTSPCRSGWSWFRSVLEHGGETLLTSPDQATTLITDARRHDPDRIHSILFTSGTSAGKPKGCPLRVGSMTHILESQSWLITPANCHRVLQQAHNARAIAPYHMLQTWRIGGAIVMPTGASFAVEHTLDAILRHGATFIVLSPAMVHALAQTLPSLGSSISASVRTIQVGGDAVTKEVLTKCAALFPQARVCINHGMSEGGGFFVWPFSDRLTNQIPYLGEICPVGAVARGARVRIWDPDRGAVSPREKPGEMHVSCDSLIREYLLDVDASAGTFYRDEDGTRWMNTGDIAMVTEGGDLVYILGRSKDAIRCGGVAIMPAALESCIEKFTGAQTCIVAVPSPGLGQQPFAVLSGLNGFTEDQIRGHVVSVFGDSYALGGVACLDQLGLLEYPVNATHKILKASVQRVVVDFVKSQAALAALTRA